MAYEFHRQSPEDFDLPIEQRQEKALTELFKIQRHRAIKECAHKNYKMRKWNYIPIYKMLLGIYRECLIDLKFNNYGRKKESRRDGEESNR